MTRPLIPFVQNGYYASRNWIPLVKGNGFTTSGGGEQEEVWETASGSIATFTAVPAPLRQLSVAVEPVQNLNGYDSPWPAGGGKNKLQVTTTTHTINGVTFTVNDDGTILVNGTASGGNAAFPLINNEQEQALIDMDAEFILSGCPSGGSATGYRVQWYLYETGRTAIDIGSGSNAFKPVLTDGNVSIVVKNGTSCNNLVFKPMIRLATENDATFAPYSNICPITGWDAVNLWRTGKNLLDKENLLNGLFPFQSQMRIAPIGAAGASVYCPIKGGETYVVSKMRSARFTIATTSELPRQDTVINNYWNVSSNTSAIVTTAETDKYLVVFFYLASADADKTQDEILNTVRVEVGSTASDYESYSGNQYTIQLGETVYGGTLDVVNGKMTVDRAMVTLDGSEEWYADGGSRYRTRRLDALVKSGRTEVLSNIGIFSNIGAGVGTIFLSPVNGVGNIYYYPPTSITTVNEFKAWLSTNNMQVVYPLATPFEIPLTPVQISTLQGTNNVWSDAGDVTVEYRSA